MSKSVADRIDALLDGAERDRSCLVPEEERDRKALLYRGLEMIEPLAGLFARRRTWARLNPRDRVLWLMRGLSQRHPQWVFSGPSAAVAHGLPVTWGRLTHVDALTGRSSWGKAGPGIRAHRDADESFELVRGLRVAPLWRAVFDCLAALPPADALAVADAALRKTGVSPQGLVDYIRTTYRGRRGVREAVRVASLADGRAESGGESVARYVMHANGFVAPELQVWVEDPVVPGTWFRVDFLWFAEDGSLIIGELDGRQKSTRPEFMGGRVTARVLQDERLRESHLTALRPAVVRFTYDDVVDEGSLVSLLDSFGVPRRRKTPELPAATVVRSAELQVINGWRVLVTEHVAA